MTAILMTEEYWANSQFSIARHYGGVNINGIGYIIVNKEGKDLFQCSREADKAGRSMAIEPGEPADLIRKDFQKYYRKLGREKFMQVLDDNKRTEHNELKKIYSELIKKPKK